MRNNNPLEVLLIFNIRGMLGRVNIKNYYHIWVSKWNFHEISDPRLFLSNLISGTNPAVKISPDLQPALSLCKNSKTCKAKYKIPSSVRVGSSCEMRTRLGGEPHGIRLMTQCSLNRLGAGGWQGAHLLRDLGGARSSD